MLFLIVFIFYEIIFALYTGNSMNSDNTGFILLFSLSFGCILTLLSSLSKKPLVNKIIRFVFLTIIPVIYMITFFVYCEFGVMYDLNTVVLGAGDAVTGFSQDIKKLIISVRGLSYILMMMLPCIMYALYVGFYKKARNVISSSIDKYFSKLNKDNILTGLDNVRIGKKSALVILGVAIISYALALVGIYANAANVSLYKDEYNYEAAVRRFGQATALRLEIKNNIFGDNDYSFGNSQMYQQDDTEIVKKQPVSDNSVSKNSVSDNSVSGNSVSANSVSENAISNNQSEEIVTTEITGTNQLDIDFESLMETASSKEKELDKYVSGLTGSSKNEYTGLFKGKNMIFITAEAFTAEVIDEELTPTLYRMATKGINFTDYYQISNAGTTGGEYSNIMGMLPSSGGASMKNTAKHLNYMTLGYQLNMLGYYGKAYHNNSYTYYDRHKTHNNLGYSEGFVGYGNGIEEYVSDKWPESDLEMMQGSMSEYINNQPFNIYYMSVSGHSLYDFNRNAMSQKHKDEVKELPYSSRVRGYIACQLELEAALTYMIDELEKAGIADDTVICVAADHYPYGLDSDGSNGTLGYLTELYGQRIDNTFIKNHNRLIIWSGCLEDREPIIVDDPTSSIDILPTLLNLFGVEYDSRLLPGRDVFSDALPLVYDLGYSWKTDKGTFVGGRFRPINEDVEIPDDYVKNVKAIVSDKIKYSKGVLNTDYYRHVFGNIEE